MSETTDEVEEPQRYTGRFVLDDDGNPIEEPDLFKWAKWFEDSDRRVDSTTINGVHVSTVFLGLDHSWSPDSDPILFETMQFGGLQDTFQYRYATKADAQAGHNEVCNRVRKRFNKKHVHPLDQCARSLGAHGMLQRRIRDLDAQLAHVAGQYKVLKGDTWIFPQTTPSSSSS